LFLSPHLDDAVFSCGEVIASMPHAVVATVFAGRPPGESAPTSWDVQCGFADGDDVIGARRFEDRQALDTLGAEPMWLDFCDDQYGRTPSADALAETIAGLLAAWQPHAVFSPLGLFHSDHRRTSDAALSVMTRFPVIEWHAYEDAIYRRLPGLVDQRIASIRQAGFEAQQAGLAITPLAHELKCRAIACYRSQLRALATRRGHEDALRPEAYWHIAWRDRA
jgi:LmbE family N-acetylglucosaminyl deacetylase